MSRMRDRILQQAGRSMKLVRIAVVGLLSGCASVPSPSTPSAADLALVGVTVVDVESGDLRPNHTVLIRGNYIVAVEPVGATPPLAGRVVDARDKYVIPGLWDMHVHLFRHGSGPRGQNRAAEFPLFLANGVTGVRDMWTDLDDIKLVRQWNRESDSGVLLAPRIQATGPVIDGAPPVWAGSLVAARADDAGALVDSLVRGGVNALKVYTRLQRDVYLALVSEARRRGLDVVGHVPASILAAEASDAGQRTIEHLQVTDDCSTDADEITKMRRESSSQGDPRVLARRLETYSDTLCSNLFERFVRNGTWQVPTLVVLRQAALRGDRSFLDAIRLHPGLRYVHQTEHDGWEAQSSQAVSRATPQGVELSRRALQNRLHIVGGMHRAGVPLLAGSDMGNPFLVAGFSLHDELAMLVSAGLTPLAALQASTSSPARYFHATDSLGTVAPGKLADLVVLDADPLRDIRNAQRIHAVVVNGRLLDRTELDAMLRGAEERAHESTPR